MVRPLQLQLTVAGAAQRIPLKGSECKLQRIATVVAASRDQELHWQGYPRGMLVPIRTARSLASEQDPLTAFTTWWTAKLFHVVGPQNHARYSSCCRLLSISCASWPLSIKRSVSKNSSAARSRGANPTCASVKAKDGHPDCNGQRSPDPKRPAHQQPRAIVVVRVVGSDGGKETGVWLPLTMRYCVHER